jgi:hypothetical protein
MPHAVATANLNERYKCSDEYRKKNMKTIEK